MAVKIRRLKIIVTSIVVISFAIVLLVPSPVVPATACKADGSGVPLSMQDISTVPQPLRDDATELASELFGNNQLKCQDFIGQLLAIYLEAKDKDVVIFLNSGGWGWAPVKDSPDWRSIIDGIESELASSGYTSLVLDHKRTAHTLNGCISEFMLAADLYPIKAKDLAARVEFLTNHIPGIKVILVGESNGAAICESAMRILKENNQVYSIEVGPPFWNKGSSSDRALLIRSNGLVPDSFSHGDIVTIIRSNLEALFGISQDNPGNILLYIGAPGHDYSWEYKEMRLQIVNSLHMWFGN